MKGSSGRNGQSFKKKLLLALDGVYFPIAAIVSALLIGGLAVWGLGYDPLAAFKSLLSGSFGNKNAVSETLVKAIPLIFTALSYGVAMRCGLINLGAEGQLYMGALAATLVGTSFNGLPAPIHIGLTLLAGFAGGAFYGAIVALLKIRFGASELITTIMLNYIAIAFVNYCVTGPLKMEGDSYPQSYPILESARLPRLITGLRLHWGIFIALAALIAFYLIIWKTTKGYEMRVIGQNPTAGAYAGMNLNKVGIRAMLLAGGFAGLGGCVEILGIQLRLIQDFSSNYGFDGIAVALLGNNHPIGIFLSGILFGALNSGSNKMQMMAKVPSAVIHIIQGLIILFVVGREMFRFRHLFIKSGKKKEVTHA